MNSIYKTGFLLIRSLVFSLLLAGCLTKKENTLSVLWEESKATGIIIPRDLLSSVPGDAGRNSLQIRLENNNAPVLGEYVDKDNAFVFRPLIAFTRGLTYNVYSGKNLIGTVKIPSANAEAPEITAVYPEVDTLPENLLKFYIRFSKPMREGEALTHIHLIKEGSDTLSSVFLDLQQELWNNDRTILTLWLDPGRIKRDLQPNKKLGPPLNKGERYQLVISPDWQSTEGVILKEAYKKSFVTVSRDSLSPEIQKWTLLAPAKGTKNKLSIHFNESIDHVLAENAIRVLDRNGKEVNGLFDADDLGRSLYFTPGNEWLPGSYHLQVESRLEDLAGNNLNRLFDTDLTQKQKEPRDFFARSFEIK